MRITLVTRNKNLATKYRLTKYATRGGSGKSSIGRLFANDEGRPVKTRSSRHMVPAVVYDPDISPKEQKKANDSEIAKLDALANFTEQTTRHFTEHGDLFEVMRRMSSDLAKQKAMVFEIYKAIHGRYPSSRELKKRKEIPNEEMAIIYLGYVIEKGVAQPTQEELMEYSKISQPSWSRKFKDPQFWKAVNSKIERLWDVNSVVKDKMEYAKSHATGVKELLVEDMRTEDGQKKTLDDVNTEIDSSMEEATDKIISPTELKRIARLDKNTVSKEIIRLRPMTRTKDLEKYSVEHLRDVLIALTAQS